MSNHVTYLHTYVDMYVCMNKCVSMYKLGFNFLL